MKATNYQSQKEREHSSLMLAVAALMDGQEPNWDNLGLSRDTRNAIAKLVSDARADRRTSALAQGFVP